MLLLGLHRAFFHPGQGEQILNQMIGPLDLGLDEFQRFAFPHLRGQGFRIGGNHSQGGFHFVAGIPDELLLLFHGFVHRLDEPMNQPHCGQAQQRVLRYRHQRRDPQHVFHVLHFQPAVHRDQQAAARFVLVQQAKKLCFNPSGRVTALQHGRGHLADFFIGIQVGAVTVPG